MNAGEQLIEQGRAEGRERGRADGRAEGLRDASIHVLAARKLWAERAGARPPDLARRRRGAHGLVERAATTVLEAQVFAGADGA